MTDYQISPGKIPSPTRPGTDQVYSALTPTGERIMNGNDMFFYSQQAAVRACEEHMQQGRVAA